MSNYTFTNWVSFFKFVLAIRNTNKLGLFFQVTFQIVSYPFDCAQDRFRAQCFGFLTKGQPIGFVFSSSHKKAQGLQRNRQSQIENRKYQNPPDSLIYWFPPFILSIFNLLSIIRTNMQKVEQILEKSSWLPPQTRNLNAPILYSVSLKIICNTLPLRNAMYNE